MVFYRIFEIYTNLIMRYFTLAILLLGLSAYAQPTISKQVIGPAGATFENGNNKLSYTAGEVLVDVPTDAEWTTLENHLIANGYNYDQTNTGNKIAKAMSSTTGWNSSPHEGAVGNDQSLNNDSEFNAVPEGVRFSSGSFNDEGNVALFWSSTEGNTNFAWYRFLSLERSHLYRGNSGSGSSLQYGFSVRFVRD